MPQPLKEALKLAKHTKFQLFYEWKQQDKPSSTQGWENNSCCSNSIYVGIMNPLELGYRLKCWFYHTWSSAIEKAYQDNACVIASMRGTDSKKEMKENRK